ncbi:MAG: 50S ribosomal protein L3 [Candidatus Buchananbacteria bacterium]
MKFILAKKVAMTQVFTPEGKVIAATKLVAEPCKIVALKDQKSDGYLAVQVGFGKKKKVSKALAGQLKGLGNFAQLKEFRFDKKGETKLPEVKVGDEVKVSVFAIGDKLNITGWAKGRGFQGVVRRHHFAGGPKTHGHKDNLRMPGAIGSGGIQKVFKGLRMPGHMGTQQVFLQGSKVLEINETDNSLLVSGSLPGARNGLLIITALGELKIAQVAELVEQPVAEVVTEASVVTEAPVSVEEVKV